MRTAPAITFVKPNWISEVFGTGYYDFVSESGVSGLAKDSGNRLDILAVIADKPGTGQFSNFIEACKKDYATICFWVIVNPVVSRTLAKRGFVRAEIEDGGETAHGWRWDAKPWVADVAGMTAAWSIQQSGNRRSGLDLANLLSNSKPRP